LRHDLTGLFPHNLRVLNVNPNLPAIENLDSATLLERAQAGDTGAFCDLCRTYETRLFRQAIALCGNNSLAEDLTEDTLVEAWESLRRYNGRCQFFTWLCAILLHRHHNELRRRRFLNFAGVPTESVCQNTIVQMPDHQLLPDQAAQHQERAAIIQTCIQALPKKHQAVIYLRFYVDDSLEGIAAALQCSVGTVKSRLFHALEKLRGMKALARERTTSNEAPQFTYETMH
jgi:RNA polymerase sigma-70 factor, ECF subfamily